MRAALSPAAYDYLRTGSGVEETLVGNRTAWRRYALAPRALHDVGTVRPATTLLGSGVTAPVGVSPVGFQRWFHPAGEVATADAARRAGVVFTLPMRATAAFDEVAPAAGDWWYQLYRLGDPELTAGSIRAAVAAGACALVLTVDTPYAAAKAHVTAPPPHLPVNALLPGRPGWDDPRCWVSPTATLADISWCRELGDGLPVVVKGVVRADDARACVDAGADAVWVSNHGGRQLDATVPTALALPQVAAAVADRAEVYVDGGVRTGRDVVRALALGATAAFVGRPVVWALATGGADRVAAYLTALSAEVSEAMALLGACSPAELTSDLVYGHQP